MLTKIHRYRKLHIVQLQDIDTAGFHHIAEAPFLIGIALRELVAVERARVLIVDLLVVSLREEF
jgi:hypothetical protein